MNNTPSLSTYNCFEILANIHDSETTSVDVQKSEEISVPLSIPTAISLSISAPTSNPETPRAQKPKWEKTLPKKLTVAAMEGISTSLKLKVEIETTDTVERKSITALLDSGEMGECINRDYAKSQRFNLTKLTQPIPVYNVDGSPNEAGSIMEVVNLILRYESHSERTTFCVTSLGKQKLILGHSWLHKHNPEINWDTGEVKMSRCPPRCCSRCRDKLCKERIVHKANARRMDMCSARPFPEIDHDLEDDSNNDLFHSGDEPLSIEEGERILATGLLPPPSMNIRASSTISQRLAEAFQSNSKALTLIPDYLREFTSVFSKQLFDVLPEPKEWDHAVELIPDSKPSRCKIYPLSPAEQKELDIFLKENLETGRI